MQPELDTCPYGETYNPPSGALVVAMEVIGRLHDQYVKTQ